MFADDTKCLKPITSISDPYFLQSDLYHLSVWSDNWKLPFNTSKSALLCFTSSSSPTFTESYYLNNTPISLVDHHKDLGIVFSSNLSWDHHYYHISHHSYKMLGLLRRTFSSTSSTETKKSLYLSLVRSQLTYASPIWRPHKIKQINMPEKIQHRATKFIHNNYSAD